MPPLQETRKIADIAHRQTKAITVRPLEPPEEARLLTAIREGLAKGWDRVKYPKADPVRTTATTVFLGVHPDVLAHPATRGLSVQSDRTGKGGETIPGAATWYRSKKERTAKRAYCYAEPDPLIVPFYREYLTHLPKLPHVARDAPYYHKAVTASGERRPYTIRTPAEAEAFGRSIGEAKTYVYCHCAQFFERQVRAFVRGIPGLEDVSPRTLRHTRLARLYEISGHDAEFVMNAGGVSEGVLHRYLQGRSYEDYWAKVRAGAASGVED